MIYSGQCRCGKLKAFFETEKALEALGAGACQCVFCRRHGSLDVSDPHGLVTIDALADDVERYCLALSTAETGEGADIRSTINVAGLRMDDFLSMDDAPMQYGAETTDERIERRFRKWTLTRFADPKLHASHFGPH